MQNSLIVGLDEVGRGPLAGPVVAAAVVLPDQFDLPGLTDSKKLSAKKREALLPLICEQALSYATGWVSPQEIDEIN
ncbi:MAG: ribonuclease HII, partial [Gammaproteobacteria bacterium]|nr:ribonuclease HII [Gammaproteobacteria bacterium]